MHIIRSDAPGPNLTLSKRVLGFVLYAFNYSDANPPFPPELCCQNWLDGLIFAAASGAIEGVEEGSRQERTWSCDIGHGNWGHERHSCETQHLESMTEAA